MANSVVFDRLVAGAARIIVSGLNNGRDVLPGDGIHWVLVADAQAAAYWGACSASEKWLVLSAIVSEVDRLVVGVADVALARHAK